MPKNEDHELQVALNHLAPLGEVPHDISTRFDETLERLVREHEQSKGRSPKRSQFSTFSVAASFFVVVAFGAVVTLNSNSEVPAVSQPGLTNLQTNPSVTEDQNLYSGDSNSEPFISEKPIQSIESGENYELISPETTKKLGFENTFRKPLNLSNTLKVCLTNLGLIEVLHGVDKGSYQGLTVTAAWSPISGTSWDIFVIDSNCNVIEKLNLD